MSTSTIDYWLSIRTKDQEISFKCDTEFEYAQIKEIQHALELLFQRSDKVKVVLEAR